MFQTMDLSTIIKLLLVKAYKAIKPYLSEFSSVAMKAALVSFAYYYVKKTLSSYKDQESRIQALSKQYSDITSRHDSLKSKLQFTVNKSELALQSLEKRLVDKQTEISSLRKIIICDRLKALGFNSAKKRQTRTLLWACTILSKEILHRNHLLDTIYEERDKAVKARDKLFKRCTDYEEQLKPKPSSGVSIGTFLLQKTFIPPSDPKLVSKPPTGMSVIALSNLYKLAIRDNRAKGQDVPSERYVMAEVKYWQELGRIPDSWSQIEASEEVVKTFQSHRPKRNKPTCHMGCDTNHNSDQCPKQTLDSVLKSAVIRKSKSKIVKTGSLQPSLIDLDDSQLPLDFISQRDQELASVCVPVNTDSVKHVDHKTQKFQTNSQLLASTSALTLEEIKEHERSLSKVLVETKSNKTKLTPEERESEMTAYSHD